MELSQQVLERRVFNQGILDLHIKDFMLGQTKPYLSKNKNSIDVGAATGMYTSFFCDHSKEVYSYEAVPAVYKQLIKVKKPNLHTYNYAVSDKKGTSDFWVDDKRLSNSSFRDLVGGQKITVETIKLDDTDIKDIGFIKIDVEGHELDVLNGAINIIEKYKPTCMVEIYEPLNNGPVKPTFDFFFDRGYKCYINVKTKGLKEVKSVKEGIEYQQWASITDGDYLFTYE